VTGSTLAHYEILDKLGEGGMGVVYKARDTHLDRHVAIKVLPAEKVANPERKARFVQEAKSASALNHPNIVTIHDIDQQDGIDFMAMEYVAGKTLDELIPRKGMRLGEALKIAVQVADALAVAHEAGIIHRDIKPGNIMVGDDGRVRVLDFGLAKLSEVVPESDETRTVVAGEAPRTEEGTILGTASYMSPEQAEGKKVDARSDIFSFGSVLYEMVTGRRPFVGDSSMSTLAAILKEEPRPVRELADDLPGEVERIVRRCLRKDVERRFQLMKDLKVELEELKEESDSGTLGGAVAVSLGRSRPFGWVVSTVCVVVTLVAAGWYWFGSGPPQETGSEMIVTPLTTYAGTERSPTFSPDGNEVAFSWNGEGQDNFDIYRKMIGSPTPLRLTTHPAWDGAPAWSPDGRSIAFGRLLDEKLVIIVIPAIGGPERVLYERRWTSESWYLPRFGFGLAWFPDSEWIVVDGEVMVSVETSEVRRLHDLSDRIQWEGAPAVSPDGRRVAFSGAFSGVHWELFVQDLDEDGSPFGAPRQLTSLNVLSTAPAWTADGTEIIFSSGTFMERKSLWRTLASGSGSPKQLLVAGDGANGPAISRQGNRLVFGSSEGSQNIMRLPVAAAEDGAGVPRPLITSTQQDYSARYSPDGAKIVFVSNRSGQVAIWMADADGSNVVELYSRPGVHLGSPRWSPDGQRLAFDMATDGAGEIFAIAASGGRPIRLTENPAADIIPSWSGDGDSIYFTSSRSGRPEVWRVPSGGGSAVQVTSTGGAYPFESMDGEHVYFLRDGGEIWRILIRSGDAEKVAEGVFQGRLGVAARGVYYIRQTGDSDGLELRLWESATGEDRLVTRIEDSVMNTPLAISPDGRYLLYDQMIDLGSDLKLVENFR
jgi:eukaryotic-like serine/threonine-protein kinase